MQGSLSSLHDLQEQKCGQTGKQLMIILKKMDTS